MLLASRPGLAAYMLLPNNWSWKLLSTSERARVLAGNVDHNTTRADYADPTKYQDGVNFDTVADRHASPRGKILAEFLDRNRPARVLEVGPGAGFYTRLIVEHPAVREYVGVDVNRAFLDYLRPRLAAIAGLNVTLIAGRLDSVAVEADAAVLMSAVHHIPDRVQLFQQLHQLLRPQGAVLAIDPTHYILRLRKLLRKCRTRGYLAAKLREQSVATHNMCRLGEYRAVARRTGFEITRAIYQDQPRRIQRLRSRGVPLGLWWRWWSQEMAIECHRA